MLEPSTWHVSRRLLPMSAVWATVVTSFITLAKASKLIYIILSIASKPCFHSKSSLSRATLAMVHSLTIYALLCKFCCRTNFAMTDDAAVVSCSSSETISDTTASDDSKTTAAETEQLSVQERIARNKARALQIRAEKRALRQEASSLVLKLPVSSKNIFDL